MKRKTILIFLAMLITLSITGCGSSKSEDKKENYDNSSYNSKSYEKEPSKDEKQEIREYSESEKMIIAISDLISKGLAFDTGNYIQGDIPAGEYAFIKFNGSGSYYCEKDAGDNIIDNENFDSFGYVYVHSAGNLETRGVLISISAFDELGVSGAKEIYEILNEKNNYNQGGYYKVGYDIEPGNYIVESYGRGYWAIMSGPVSSSDIVDNDNFNGRTSINLANGQYLDLSTATITKVE